MNLTTNYAEPFSFSGRSQTTRGEKVGVLLLHGFGGQPASVLPWGRSLAERGYCVAGPLLPGHGTTWQAMAKTTWRDWYGEVVRAFDRLSTTCDVTFVGGLSLGGSLVLQLAADRPDDVAGVVVVNPAASLSTRRSWLTPLVKHVVASVQSPPEDIKREGVTGGGYTRISVKAGHEAMKAMKPLVKSLRCVTAPLLYFRSTVDHKVGPESAALIVQGVGSSEVTVRLLENSYHTATLDYDAETIFDESAAFIARIAGIDPEVGPTVHRP